MPKVKRKVRRIPKHIFRFRFETEEGEAPSHFNWPTKVKHAKSRVELVLTAADVRKAMKQNGFGNTERCAAAVCAKRHKHLFPHLVEGYIDWQYRSCFVVSKKGKNGLPSECVYYQHRSEVAKLFDSKAGLEILLRKLEEDGDITIILYPPVQRTDLQPGRRASSTGTRTTRPHTGALLRYANALVGYGAIPA